MERYSKNPILTRQDVHGSLPRWQNVSSVFNPGAVRFESNILLVARVQNRGRETGFFIAESSDGIHFRIRPEPVKLHGLDGLDEPVFHCYDARVTFLDDRWYLLFAMDMPSGCCLGLAATEDFEHFRFLGICSGNDVRNGVLFPQRWGSYYYRLERPNLSRLDGGVKSGSVILLSRSTDLMDWEPVKSVLEGRPRYWDELIGSGPPPLKTESGWLQIYHGIATHFGSANIYQAGVCLLDLEQPWRVIARGSQNILEPRMPFELTGQVPNVVFPCGWVPEHTDRNGTVPIDANLKIYYGAADSCIGLASAKVSELIRACHQ